jgi:hypothetical protein
MSIVEVTYSTQVNTNLGKVLYKGKITLFGGK